MKSSLARIAGAAATWSGLPFQRRFWGARRSPPVARCAVARCSVLVGGFGDRRQLGRSARHVPDGRRSFLADWTDWLALVFTDAMLVFLFFCFLLVPAPVEAEGG
jgi:hypothetical protein